MDLRSLITVQCLKVNLRSANLDAGAGRNQSALRRGDLLARMLITRTRPVVRPIRQSLGRRGRKPRTAPQRSWHASRDPAREGERSDWYRRAFACSPDTPTTTGGLRRPADLSEGHTFALPARENPFK